MALFYFNLFYLTPVILKRRGVGSLVTVLLFLIVIVSFFNAGFHEYFVERRGLGLQPPPPPDEMPPFDGERNQPPMMFASPSFSSLLITIIVVAVSSMLVLWENWTKAQAEKQDQILQKVAAELTALKLQISPHFLFNTLNNIRWLVRSKSEYAEDAIVKLSHLLRYILYQTEADEVDLEREISHLSDFVALQKMRVVNPHSIHFSVGGHPVGKRIVPLLLLPLVENFFKHGDFSASDANMISIEVNDYRLIFKSANHILTTEEKENGIGLHNVKRRLALHYPDRHMLKYYERDSVYYLELELILGSI